MKPLVYIIILNYNGYKDTIRCLTSLKKLTYSNYEVVVIDNNSSDESADYIRKSFPEVDLIVNSVNLGFAGGNNVAIKHALEQGADYIWLLNNDTEVDAQALEELVNVAEQDASIGMVGSKIYHLEDRKKLLFAGGKINWLLGHCYHNTRESDSKKIKDVDFITGCSTLIRSNVIEKVGLMSEEFFLYYEDTDWGIRIKKAGFRLVYAPASIVYHNESSTVGMLTPIKQYYCTRNNLILMKKHVSGYMLVTIVPVYFVKIIIKAIMFITRGQPRLTKYLLQGAIDGFNGKSGYSRID